MKHQIKQKDNLQVRLIKSFMYNLRKILREQLHCRLCGDVYNNVNKSLFRRMNDRLYVRLGDRVWVRLKNEI